MRLPRISAITSITVVHILGSAFNHQRAVWSHTHLYDVFFFFFFTVNAEENSVKEKEKKEQQLCVHVTTTLHKKVRFLSERDTTNTSLVFVGDFRVLGFRNASER